MTYCGRGRVFVVVHPDAGEGVTHPWANRNAMNEVERAIEKWGRFSLVSDPQTADLVIAVRVGNKSGPASSAIRRWIPARRSISPEFRTLASGQCTDQPGRPPDLRPSSLPGDSGNRNPANWQSGDFVRRYPRSVSGRRRVSAGRGASLALHRKGFTQSAASRRRRAIPQSDRRIGKAEPAQTLDCARRP